MLQNFGHPLIAQKFKLVAQAVKTSTSTPSEISEIMFSISQLANTLGTLITYRTNMKSINDIQSLKTSTTRMSLVINPLDHMDDVRRSSVRVVGKASSI